MWICQWGEISSDCSLFMNIAAEAERGPSLMNDVKTKKRTHLETPKLSGVMTILMSGP